MTRPSRLLRPYLARHWLALAFAGLASLAIALAELARPFPLGLAVDHLIGDSARGGFALDAADVELLAGIGLLVLAIAGVNALAGYLADLALRRAGERITHDLRTATHEHLQRLSLGFHERRHTGDLVTRVTGDVNAVGALFSESLGTIVQAVLLLVGMLVVSLVIDPVLALAAFAVSPILAVVTFRFRRRLKAAARRQRAREGEIAALTGESFAAMREVKASGTEVFEHDRLERKSEERRDAGMETYLIEGRFTGVIDMLGAVGAALVLVVGVLRVASGAISVGDLIVMHSYARRMYGRSAISPARRGAWLAPWREPSAWRRCWETTRCSTSAPAPSAAAGRAARSRSSPCPSPTGSGRCCATPRCTCRPDRGSPWSGAPARASRRSPRSSRASTSPRGAAC